MDTIQVSLNKSIAESAAIYARQKGVELSAIIEDYLVRIVHKKNEKATDKAIPDVVLSLLGAGTSVDENDLNGRKAYYAHLEEKYQ